MSSSLILPARFRARSSATVTDVGVFVPVATVFPGAQQIESALVQTLQGLLRDDVIFQCAMINIIVSGQSPLDARGRQQAAVRIVPKL
jgi:hypothetical protein